MNTSIRRNLESYVPLRLYSISRGHLSLLWGVSVVVTIIALIVHLNGPVAYGSIRYSDLLTNSPHQSFVITTPPLSIFNRELWISADVKRLRQNGLVNFTSSIKVIIPLNLREPRYDSLNPNYEGSDVQFGPVHKRNLTLKCTHKHCQQLNLLHLVPIDYTIYTFHIELNQLHLSVNDINDNYQNTNSSPCVDFQITYYSNTYNYYILIVRFVVFVLLKIVTLIFYDSLRNYYLRYWTIEQKVTALLLLLCTLYSNPFHSLEYLTKNWFPSYMDYVFTVTFISGLLFSWLTLYHTLCLPHCDFHRLCLSKLFFIFPFWCALIILTGWKTYNEYNQPMFVVMQYPHLVNYVGYFLVMFAVIYALYLSVLIMRAYIQLKEMSHLYLRLNFVTIYSINLLISLVIWQSYLLYHRHHHQSPTAAAATTGLIDVTTSDRSILTDLFLTYFVQTTHTLYNQILFTYYMIILVYVYSVSRNVNIDLCFKDDLDKLLIIDQDGGESK